jgi:2-keto-4-pentenoate hydratase
MTAGAADLAARLIGVRGGGPLIETVSADDRPRDLAAALAVSMQVADAQGARAGWKIGATAPGAPAALGLAEPLFAPIPKAGLRGAPARWVAGPDGLTLDAEVVFELAATPADGSHPALKAAVGSIRLGIEINRPSYVRPFEAGGLAIIADMGAHAGLVQGAWLDHGADLAALEVTLGDGANAATGTGAAVLGDPWAALAWLAATLPRFGQALQAGDVVASGALCSIRAGAGAVVRLEAPGCATLELAID